MSPDNMGSFGPNGNPGKVPPPQNVAPRGFALGDDGTVGGPGGTPITPNVLQVSGQLANNDVPVWNATLNQWVASPRPPFAYGFWNGATGTGGQNINIPSGSVVEVPWDSGGPTLVNGVGFNNAQGNQYFTIQANNGSVYRVTAAYYVQVVVPTSPVPTGAIIGVLRRNGIHVPGSYRVLLPTSSVTNTTSINYGATMVLDHIGVFSPGDAVDVAIWNHTNIAIQIYTVLLDDNTNAAAQFMIQQVACVPSTRWTDARHDDHYSLTMANDHRLDTIQDMVQSHDRAIKDILTTLRDSKSERYNRLMFLAAISSPAVSAIIAILYHHG